MGVIQIWYHTFFGIKPPYPHMTFYIVILTLFGNYNTTPPPRSRRDIIFERSLVFYFLSKKIYSYLSILLRCTWPKGAVQIYYYPFFGNFWTPSPPSPSYTFLTFGQTPPQCSIRGHSHISWHPIGGRGLENFVSIVSARGGGVWQKCQLTKC